MTTRPESRPSPSTRPFSVFGIECWHLQGFVALLRDGIRIRLVRIPDTRDELWHKALQHFSAIAVRIQTSP
jgi:hypothetical protein